MVLDTPAESVYDDFTRLLARNLDVPIAMVNLLDAHRDWFKSCVGLDLTESAAATSFCESLFGTPDDLVVVPDTLLDPRFADHPFVRDAPNIRFYAGARLAVDGLTVGTLCAYDLKPKHVSTLQLDHMRALAQAVIATLRARAAPSA
jgi:GAF domain-containing protein